MHACGESLARVLRENIRSRPATDKMDNLQPVAGVERSGGPPVALNDVAVELDRHSVLLHAKFFNQTGKGEGSFEAALFAIDDQIHGIAVRCTVSQSLPYRTAGSVRGTARPRTSEFLALAFRNGKF